MCSDLDHIGKISDSADSATRRNCRSPRQQKYGRQSLRCRSYSGRCAWRACPARCWCAGCRSQQSGDRWSHRNHQPVRNQVKYEVRNVLLCFCFWLSSILTFFHSFFDILYSFRFSFCTQQQWGRAIICFAKVVVQIIFDFLQPLWLYPLWYVLSAPWWSINALQVVDALQKWKPKMAAPCHGSADFCPLILKKLQ